MAEVESQQQQPNQQQSSGGVSTDPASNTDQDSNQSGDNSFDAIKVGDTTQGKKVLGMFNILLLLYTITFFSSHYHNCL